MSQRKIVTLLVALALAPAAGAEDRPSESKRGAYVVKSASAKDLAAVLAKHFKGAAEIQAGPEGTNNVLLVSAPPAVFDEVMKTLELLDKKPQAVAVEVLVVELPDRKADDKDKDKGPDEKEFAGPIDDVAKAVEAMQKKGQVAGVKCIRLTALEGQPASLTLGETKPYVTGVVTTARGVVSRQIQYRNTGTQLRVTPQVAADKSVTLDLSLEDSRLHSSDSLPAVGADEKGNAIPATEFVATRLEAKVSVASGKAVLARDAKVTSKAGESRVLIVVGARVVEPEKK
jgi:type II secretory pathway component GspD/PulD (secretin)